MRHTATVLAGLMLLAACSTGGDDPGPDTLPPNDQSTTTTSTSAPSTTTTVPAPPFENLTRITRLDAGTLYRYAGGELPSAFVINVALPDWEVDEIGDGFVQLQTHHPDAGPGVWAAVVSFRSGEGVDDLIAFFLDEENQIGKEGPTSRSVGGLDGHQIDVLVPEREGDSPNDVGPTNYQPGDLDCSERVEFFRVSVSSQPRPWAQGLVGCAWNRVVIVDVEGITMLLTVSPDERSKDYINTIEDLGPYVDDFINAITFCTDETPCDD